MQFSHAEGYIHSQCILQWSPVCIRSSHSLPVLCCYGSTTWNFPYGSQGFPGHPWSVIVLLSLVKGSLFAYYSIIVYGNACMRSEYYITLGEGKLALFFSLNQMGAKQQFCECLFLIVVSITSLLQN